MRKVLSLVVLLGVVGIAEAQKVDPDAVARKVVEAANVREGERVFITGGAADAELLDDLAFWVRKRGAFPVVSLDSNRNLRRSFDEIPAKYDSQPRELDIALATLADVSIFIELDIPPPGTLDGVPAERIAARAAAGKVVGDIGRARKMRAINLGNGMYPGPNVAQVMGVSKEELAKLFWGAIDVDYAKMGQTAQALKAALGAGHELEITHPNGTNLKMRVEERPVLISDGVISDEERAAGDAGRFVFLPAGEVFLTPVPGSAQGTIVDDYKPVPSRQKTVQGLTLTVKDGRLVSMSAKTNLEALQKDYDAEAAGKELFAAIDFGVNPNVRGKGKLETWVSTGMVSYSFGNDVWAGGSNAASYELIGHLPGCTVKLDGKVLVDAGTLKVP